MTGRVCAAAAAALVSAFIGWAPAASAWEISPFVTVTAATECAMVAQYPKYCSPGSLVLFVDRTLVKIAGGSLEINTRLLRKVGKNWVNVPVKTSLAPDKSVRYDSSISVLDTFGKNVYPMQERLSKYGAGHYMLVFGDTIEARWSCSVYSYDICRWKEGYSNVARVRFYLDSTGISQQQWDMGVS